MGWQHRPAAELAARKEARRLKQLERDRRNRAKRRKPPPINPDGSLRVDLRFKEFRHLRGVYKHPPYAKRYPHLIEKQRQKERKRPDIGDLRYRHNRELAGLKLPVVENGVFVASGIEVGPKVKNPGRSRSSISVGLDSLFKAELTHMAATLGITRAALARLCLREYLKALKKVGAP